MRIEATPPRKGRQGVVVRSRELVEKYARSSNQPFVSHDAGGVVPVLATSVPSLQLTEVSLTNFCLFKEARATFHQDPERPICIIEAQNGHGKSTFLRALHFALYGANRTQLVDYLHHYAEPPTARMEVVLKFQSHRGQVVLKRKAELDSTSGGWEAASTPDLTISIGTVDDGETLHESDAEEWVDMYLPKSIMDFFCFDAENSLVNDMAQGAASNKLVAEALESVLGVTTIRTIAERCQKIRREWEREEEDSDSLTPKAAQAELANIESQQDSVKRKLESFHREKEELKEDHRRLVQRIESFLARFDPAAEGERQLLRERLLEVEKELQQWEDSQEELVGFILPLQILDGLLQETIAEAQVQREFELSDERVKGLHSALKAVARLAVQEKIPWVEEPMPTEEAILARLTEEIHAPEVKEEEAPTLSEREIYELEALLKRSHAASPVVEQVDKVRQLRSQKVELEHKCQSRRSTGAHQEMMEEHRLLMDRKEDSVSRLAVIEERIANLALRQEELRREHQEATSELKSARKAEKRLKARKAKIKLARGAAKVLEEFTIKLRSLRVETLEREASELFRRITNKPELYNTISFDRQTLHYQLLDHEGHPVPLRRSTGEKAVLAMAVVHGLQKASGRSLPLIVEAPLKPLDPVHTTGVLTHFFANHTGQSILLLKPSELPATMAPTVAPKVGQKIVLKRPEPNKDLSVLVEEKVAP